MNSPQYNQLTLHKEIQISNFELVLKLLLQLTIMLGTCRLVTVIGNRYLGQTDVVCEMIAGVMLSPSLFGLIAPDFQQWIFPKAPNYWCANECSRFDGVNYPQYWT